MSNPWQTAAAAEESAAPAFKYVDSENWEFSFSKLVLRNLETPVTAADSQRTAAAAANMQANS